MGSSSSSSSESSSSKSSSKSSKSAKFGEDWTYRVYFDPNADRSDGKEYWIAHDELIAKISKLIDINQIISRVVTYKVPLSKYQLTDFLLYHMFVVFKTFSRTEDRSGYDDWWWSIEKNSEGITIQRSKYEAYVLYKYRRCDRTGFLGSVSRMEFDETRFPRTIRDLLDHLIVKQWLHRPYNYMISNCKHFAKNIFDEFAASTTVQIEGEQGDARI